MRSRTKLFPQRLQFLQVELILLLVLDLLLDTFENADSGGIVVYALTAASTTVVEGTKSCAKQLFRPR